MGLVSVLQKPKLGLIIRGIQIFFALAVLVLLSYSGSHRSYWTGVNGPIALGVVTFFFTWAVGIFFMIQYFKGNGGIPSHGKMFRILRTAGEFIILLMWIGTATLMLRPRGHDFSKPLIPAPPDVPWDLGIACSFVEVVCFIVSVPVVWFESSGGSASFGGSKPTTYV